MAARRHRGDAAPFDEISRHVAEGAHAVLLLDRDGWHTTAKLDMPSNITPIFLPSRAQELNPHLAVPARQWLSNLVFETYDDIIDTACDAWRKLHRPARNHPLNRNARMGPQRSDPVIPRTLEGKPVLR